MRLHLIGVGQKMPDWVKRGYEEYSRRMSGNISLGLREVPLSKRSKNSVSERVAEDESHLLLRAVPERARIVCLDVDGKAWSTRQLSQKLDRWMQDFSDIALLVGGPDGLSDNCLKCAHDHWSLSALTLPHMLVRIIVAEQLYRAWSLLNNHPYHRE